MQVLYIRDVKSKVNNAHFTEKNQEKQKRIDKICMTENCCKKLEILKQDYSQTILTTITN